MSLAPRLSSGRAGEPCAKKMEMTYQYVVIERTYAHSVPFNPIDKTEELCMSKEELISQHRPLDLAESSLVPPW
jgi:hypothetical protein